MKRLTLIVGIIVGILILLGAYRYYVQRQPNHAMGLGAAIAKLAVADKNNNFFCPIF